MSKTVCTQKQQTQKTQLLSNGKGMHTQRQNNNNKKICEPG